jgi:uncharacterized protein (DUF433 family)
VLSETIRYPDEMADLITEVVAGEPYLYRQLGQFVVQAVGVCSGRPTFKYTRIEITGTLARLANGETLDSIVQGYAGRVSKEAVLEANEIMTREFLLHLPNLQNA